MTTHPPHTIDYRQRARRIAEQVHEGQVDKLGHAYIGHIRRVAESASRWVDAHMEPGPQADAIVAAAWLHDVVEDTDVTAEKLGETFPAETIDIIRAVTHRKDEQPQAYAQRIRETPHARIVKAADLKDNTDPGRLSQLDEATRQRLEAKYATMRELLGIDRGDLD